MLSRITSRSLGLISTMILARILTPSDFGTVAIAMLVLSASLAFTEFGLKQAVIVIKDEDHKLLSTVWTFELLKGCILTITIFILSGQLSIFFKLPDSLNLIRLVSLVPLIRGFVSIGVISLQKKFNFKKLFIYEFSGTIVQVISSIALGLIFESPSAIILGIIFGECTKLVLSYVVAPYYCSLLIERSSLHETFSFGFWLFFGSILSYLSIEIDSYIIARNFDSESLGIYSLAFTFSTKPIVEIGKSIGKVLFPTFASLNLQDSGVINKYLKSNTVLNFLVLPIPIIFILFSKDLVVLFFGKDWLSMVNLIRLLSIASIFRLFTLPSGGFFKGMKKPHIVTTLSLIRISVTCAGFMFMNNYTLENIAKIVLIANLSMYVSYILILCHVLGVRLSLVLRPALETLGIVCLIFLVPFTLGSLFSNVWLRGGIIIISVVFSYGGCFYLLSKSSRLSYLTSVFLQTLKFRNANE